MLDTQLVGILEQADRPLGAYEIARRSGWEDAPLTPTQVYRVLERLTRAGKVRRVESLSAYLLAGDTDGGFMVCECCRGVQAFPVGDVIAECDGIYAAARFSVIRLTLEVVGRCAACAKKDDGAAGSVAG
ncbi:Fur family transcriptional regulator [Sphingosinicella sp. CPCC 101087]|uniref:Fur family transcriptional regulator n=1 Tax=Sphingosinicella sp. CPCC 101087 TaxID=2497754 RepID=UPI00101C6373|nr:hypothetical protein [Sphingosinicella sp. CPCC 101087]